MQKSHQTYASENKNVFSLDLKILTEEACLMESGKSFKSLGAAIQRARSPLHLNLDLGVNNRSWLDDRRDLIGRYSVVTHRDRVREIYKWGVKYLNPL